MKTFEYTVTFLPNGDTSDIVKELNEFGEEGWEAVNTERSEAVIIVWFKREKDTIKKRVHRIRD